MNGLALCAGLDGIGLGLSIVDPEYRTICVVEREAYAAAVLATRMGEGAMAPCPIWDDLGTFDGKRWRGLVDIVHAGLPCQPYSLAGKRQGDRDERYIWRDFFRIVDEVRAPMVFIENVPGLLQWFRPIGEELCGLGYEITGGIFSAAEVGASHRRERLFILAHRGLADAKRAEWRPEVERGRHVEQGSDVDGEAAGGAGECGRVLEYADSAIGRAEFAARESTGNGRAGSSGTGSAVADAGQPGLQGRQLGGAFGNRGGGRKHLGQLPNFVTRIFLNSRQDQTSMNNGGKSSGDGRSSRPLWPTATARAADWSGGLRHSTASRHSGTTLTDAIGRKKLNPNFVGWLQGFPIGWADITVSINSEDMETQLSRYRRHLRSLLWREK